MRIVTTFPRPVLPKLPMLAGFAIALLVSAVLPTLARAQASAPAPQQSEAGAPDKAIADAQNPIAHVISIPLQNNLYTRVGPYKKTADSFLLQPVIPIGLNEDWTLVTRTIVPVVYEPRLSPEQGEKTGLGNIEPQVYLTPTHPGKLIWGVGAQLWLPTASDKELGENHWGGGPTAVALTIDGPWVVGALVNNVWAGGRGSQRVNELTFNPFVNYNMHRGWYVASTPVITANWARKDSDRWTVPVGGGFGRVFAWDGVHYNARVEVFRNVSRPQYAPSTQVQLQLQILLPEGK